MFNYHQQDVMNSPLISIFLPFYNDQDFLEQSITACFKQKYNNWELFLFDHASTDNSSQIAKKFLNDNRVHYIRVEENLGAGSGANLQSCLPDMKGKYLKLLCADDEMTTDCLLECSKFMESNPLIDFCFSDMQYIDENEKKINTKWSLEIEGVNFNNDEKKTLKTFFLGKSHLAYPTSFLKLDILKNTILNSTYIMLFDVWLWTSLLLQGKKIGFINKTLILYRCHKNQMSSINNVKLATRRGYFEYSSICSLYYSITDIKLTKYLVDSKFAKKLKEGDESLIPFVIAHYYFSASSHLKDFPSGAEPFILNGFNKLCQILNNPIEREKIRERFDYGIKDFRKEYSFPAVQQAKKYDRRLFNDFRIKANELSGKDLTVTMILFLILKKIYKKILPNWKKKNKYTV